MVNLLETPNENTVICSSVSRVSNLQGGVVHFHMQLSKYVRSMHAIKGVSLKLLETVR